MTHINNRLINSKTINFLKNYIFDGGKKFKRNWYFLGVTLNIPDENVNYEEKNILFSDDFGRKKNILFSFSLLGSRKKEINLVLRRLRYMS